VQASNSRFLSQEKKKEHSIITIVPSVVEKIRKGDKMMCPLRLTTTTCLRLVFVNLLLSLGNETDVPFFPIAAAHRASLQNYWIDGPFADP
jgi:hypothetical protein